MSILSDMADTLHKGDTEVLKHKFCDGIIRRLKTHQKLTDNEIADMGKHTLAGQVITTMYDIHLDELTYEFDYTPEELTIFMRECDACDTIRCSDFVVSFYNIFQNWVVTEVCKRLGKAEEEITTTWSGTWNPAGVWDNASLNDIIGAISRPIKDSGSMFGGVYLGTDDLEL